MSTVIAEPFPAAGEDAELLAVYRQLMAAEAELTALVGDPSSDYDELAATPLAAANTACDRLEIMPARTGAGLRAKAEAMRWAFELAVCRCQNCDGRTSIATIKQDGEWHERLAWSLARDVLAWRAEA